MKRITGNYMTTFATGFEDFMLDIIETKDPDGQGMYDSWLYRKNTGHKVFIIGEYKKYYPGMTASQYARKQIQYLNTVNKYGMNYYQDYDQTIEDIEIADWKRFKAEKEVK